MNGIDLQKVEDQRMVSSRRLWTPLEERRLHRWLVEDKLTIAQIAARLGRPVGGVKDKICVMGIGKSRMKRREMVYVNAYNLSKMIGLHTTTLLQYIDWGMFPFEWKIVKHSAVLADQDDVWRWAGQAEKLYFVPIERCGNNWVANRIRQTLAEWDDEWLSMAEIAAQWPISRTQVWNLHARGLMQGTKWGKRVRVRRSEFLRAYEQWAKGGVCP
jgi:hypothetical protein